MTVSFDAQSAADTTGAAATSFSDSTNLTVGSGIGRALIVCVAWSTSTAPTGISITWNGATLTQLIIHSASSGSTAALYGMINPDPGTNTLAGSWTGARDFYMAGISFIGVDQTNTATAFSTNFGIGTSTAANITIPSPPVSDMVLALFAVAATITNVTNGTTPGTQIFLDNTQTSFKAGAVQAQGIGSNEGLASLNTSAAWVAVRARIVAGQFADPTIKPRETVLSKLFQWVYAPAFQPYNPSLYSVVQAPFAQTDWSKPFVLPQLPQQPAAYNLNLFTNPIPFGPFDYGDGAFRLPPFRPDTTQPFNANLYTNPIPFAKFDYPPVEQPPWVPPQALPYNINIFTNPIPFGPFDYSAGAFRVFPFRPDATQPLNPNIFTNPFPFTPVDYSAITPRIPRAPDQAYYNLNVYTVVIVAAPFVPIDYSKPFFPRVLPPNPLSVNVQLYTNPIPIFNFDTSAPNRIDGFPTAPQPYNINLYGVVTVQVPFAQYDWPVAKFAKSSAANISQVANVNLFANLSMVIDWSASASRIKPNLPDQQPYNQLLYSGVVVQSPFIPIDWSKPFFPRALLLDPQSVNIQLFTNPIPFLNLDLKGVSKPTGTPDLSVPYNVNLYGIVTVVPFAQYDWSRPLPVRPVLAPVQAYNVNIFTNPIPFAQYFWPLQFNVPQTPVNRSVQTNINLFKNPIPFVQNQYPGQSPVKIGLIHIPPYNQNLYSVTPAPGQNLHVVKFIGNMGHFMIR